jgi:hypothetical protein
MSLLNPEKIKSSIKNLETEIQKWLEPPASSQTPFQVATDFENDRFQLNTNDRDEFFVLLFSRLASYFEKGFLLEAQTLDAEPEWYCTLHFANGQIFLAEPSIKTEFALPTPGPNRVVRSTPWSWDLKSPEWRQMIPQTKEWTALVFEITPDIRFLFCTQLAEPWLKVQTENAHNFIVTAMTVLP